MEVMPYSLLMWHFLLASRLGSKVPMAAEDCLTPFLSHPPVSAGEQSLLITTLLTLSLPPSPRTRGLVNLLVRVQLMTLVH